jgi:hypothetical protein
MVASFYLELFTLNDIANQMPLKIYKIGPFSAIL